MAATTPVSAANAAESDPERELLARRLNQILACVAAATLVILLNYAIAGAWLPCLIAATELAFVAAAAWLARSGRTLAGSLLLLGSMTAAVIAAMWLGQGVYGAAPMALPVILVFASLLTRPRYLWSLLAIMLAAVSVIVLSSVLGWRSFVPLPLSVARLVLLLCVLSLTALAAWMLSNDLRAAMLRLRAEIERVNQSQASLTYLARYDALTALPNRVLGHEYFERAVAHARRHGGRVALIFIDLDNFKNINDSMGHSAGDEFLRQVAKRLVTSVRESDTVSRHGGDEFLIVLPDVPDVESVRAAATHLLAALVQPFQVRDRKIETSCSMGISMFPDDGQDFETLLRQSDMAMYTAKTAGRNTLRFFDKMMNADMLEELNLVAELRLALTRSEFVLHYQPVLDLATGRLAGAEALIRWQHPQRGMVPPIKFIPAAERCGLIVEIGQWVLHEACRQLRAWQDAGAPEFVLAVNLSMVQFRRGAIETVVADALGRHGTNPALLELELTESGLVHDSEKFIETLQSLKALGVRLSIDDFGTGYSNLAYLQRFDIDKLKVDQSFVRRLLASPQDRAIVRAIIQMAKALNLDTTAEGIEDQATLEQLAQMGCLQGQGYLFARPQPAEQLSAFFDRSGPWTGLSP